MADDLNFGDLQYQNELLAEQLEINRQNVDELRDQISLTKKLSEQARITREQQLRLNRTNRELTDLNKTLIDQLKDRNNLNRKESEITKDLIKQKKIQNSLETEIKELQSKSDLLKGKNKKAIDNIILGLKEQLLINNEISESLRIEQEITEDINKSLGVTNGLAMGINQSLKKMGMTQLSEQLGIDDAIGKTREYAKTLVEAQRNSGDGGNFGTTLVNNLKTASNLVKNLGANLAKSLGPVAIIAMLVDAMLSLDKLAGETAKQFGISYNQARGLNDEINAIAYNTGNIFVDSQKLNQSFLELSEILGTNTMLSEESLINYTELTKQAGYSNEAAGQLYKLKLLTNKSEKEIAANFLGQVKAQNIKNGLAINEKTFLNDINNISKATLLTYTAQGKELGTASAQAKMLGSDLKQLESISQSLLDIESSIAAEFEAEQMTGKSLNLERARYYALTNDLGGLAQELNKQGITSVEYGKMNVLQQEAQAKAFGMSRDEMANMLMEGEALNKIGAKNKEEARARYNELVKQYGIEGAIKQLGDEQLANQFASTSAQERFQATLTKLQDVFTQIAEPLMPVLDLLGEIFTILGPIVSFISDGMAPAFKAVGLVVNGIVDSLKWIFSFGKSDFSNTKSSWEGYKSSLGNLPQVRIAKNFTGIEDGSIDKNGGLLVSGPKGSIQLDKEDTFIGNKDGIVAGTNLGGKKENTPIQSSESSITVLSSTLGNKMDVMINKLDNLITAVNKGMTVNLDGNKVSQNILTPLAINNRRV